MSLNTTRWSSVLLSIAIVLSVIVAPAVGTGLPAGDDLAPSVERDASSSEDVEVSEAVRQASGTTNVIVRFKSTDGVRTSATTDVVTAMQTQAASNHRQLTKLAETSGDDLTVLEKFWVTSAALVRVDRDSAAFRELKQLPDVRRIHRNHKIEPPEQKPPTDAAVQNGVNTTYGLAQIDTVEAWNQFDTRGGNAKVAVLDTGVDVSHPDIELYTENESDPTYPGGWAEFNESGVRLNSTPRDDDGHGTHVSGTVSGGNASGRHIGVAPNVDLIHGMVVGDNGGTFAAVIAGIEWAVEENADVINLSLGPPGGGYVSELIEPVRNARAAGMFVVASAGNVGEGTSGSPGNVYESLAVGATNENRGIASISSGETIETNETWGSDAPEEWPDEYTVPDVSAPGASVLSASSGGGYERKLGTSMATPHVAGIAALIESVDPNATPDEMERALTQTAAKPDDAPIRKDVRYGTGIVDADAAVSAVVDESSIEGTVTQNGAPVTDAVVELAGGPRVRTDENGTVSLLAEPGQQELTVTGFGLRTTTETVTVEANETSTVGIATDPTLDVELLEAQPDDVEAGTAANLTVNVANVEELTIELTGTYDEANATLIVGGREAEFGQALPLAGYTGTVPISVVTAPNTTGSFELQHTFVGTGDERTVTTGPTEVFAKRITVGVVDADRTGVTNATIEAVDSQLSPRYTLEYVAAENATEVVDEYDAFLVQNPGDAETAGEFVDATRSSGVGVVLLDQWGDASNAIPQVSEATGTPATTDQNDGGTKPVEYELQADHPIVDGVGEPGENVTLHTGTYADHSWFENAGDATVLAGVGDQDGIAGEGLAVNENTNTVYASSLGRSDFLGNDVFTDDANALLANAVEHVADATGPEPEGAMTIENTNVSTETGVTSVTVSTTATGVAGYQANVSFDPSVVQVKNVEGANFRDPVVNIDNDAGYVSIAQSQASAIDKPVLAELTLEVVGERGASTELTFDRKRSLVNDRSGETIPTTFENGGVTIQNCAPGDVNEDGTVTSGDATLVLRHIVGEQIDGTFNQHCADVNGDGKITSGDATGILQRVVGSA